jgi:hypothetical protein
VRQAEFRTHSLLVNAQVEPNRRQAEENFNDHQARSGYNQYRTTNCIKAGEIQDQAEFLNTQFTCEQLCFSHHFITRC